MAQIFDRSSNALTRMSLILTGLLIIAMGLTLDELQRSPWVTRQGQRADQPVPFSHKHHVEGLGLQCQYCHTTVEKSSYAGIPPTKTCMNCHAQIWTDAQLLEPVRHSWATGESIAWNRVHDLPDYVFFNHEIHVNKGIGCSSCHGRVDRMPIMYMENSLQMEWCLDCHRNPAKNLRPASEIYNMAWKGASELNPGMVRGGGCEQRDANRGRSDVHGDGSWRRGADGGGKCAADGHTCADGGKRDREREHESNPVAGGDALREVHEPAGAGAVPVAALRHSQSAGADQLRGLSPMKKRQGTGYRVQGAGQSSVLSAQDAELAGAKAPALFGSDAARLKPCPDTKPESEIGVVTMAASVSENGLVQIEAKKPLSLAEVRAKLAGQKGKKFWRSIDELAETPEFGELVAKEFPSQASEWIDPVSRRSFLKVMGASMALAGLAGCTKQPDEPIYPYVTAPPDLVLGKPVYFATAFPFASGVGAGAD